MGRYASDTSVSTEKTRAEIERTLRRYGCGDFGYSMVGGTARLGFRMKGLSIMFVLTLPPLAQFARTPGRHQARTPAATEAAWEQACRQRWRALALCIKAKLEAVECGITTMEDEFLAFIVTETGETIGARMVPHLKEIAAGKVPLLLSGPH